MRAEQLVLNGKELPLDGVAQRRPDPARRQGSPTCPRTASALGLIMDFAAWENIGFGYHNEPEYQMNALLMDNAALQADAAKKMETLRRPAAESGAAGQELLGRQPAEDRAGARDRARTRTCCWSASRPAASTSAPSSSSTSRSCALRDAGKAVLLVSVELDEILSLADRILVMFDGRIMGERRPDQTDERELGLLMAGITE